MKLFELHGENPDEHAEVIATLQKDCKKFLDEVNVTGNTQLWRGTDDVPTGTGFTKMKMIHNRLPMSTKHHIHDFLNDFFQDKFGWKARNGVFCMGNINGVKAYGPPYAIFPIGNYKYIWSPDVDDVFSDIVSDYPRDEALAKNHVYPQLGERLKKIDWRTDDMEVALNEYPDKEIMLHAPEYYVIAWRLVKELDWNKIHETN